MKKILFSLAVITICVAGCGKKSSIESADAHSDTVGKTVANAVLQVSQMDVSALSDMTEKIKGACAKNKYGLSEEACVQAIDDRKDVCLQQTAQKYPGQLSDVDRMQEVISSHLDCIFQKSPA